MKVFLSWSGETSNKVALVFKEWLPSVIQSIKPFVSSEDIDKGARWSIDIASELEESKLGILCVTKDNVNAPWLIFEAGALSKIVSSSSVCPFLLDMKSTDLKGPLVQFQSTLFDKEEILKLIKTINNKADQNERLDESAVDKAFVVWWPTLELQLKEIVKSTSHNIDSKKNKEPSLEMLEELLGLARTNMRILQSPEQFLPKDYIRYVLNPNSHTNYDSINDQIRGLLMTIESMLYSFENKMNNNEAYGSLRNEFQGLKMYFNNYKNLLFQKELLISEWRSGIR